MPDPQHDLNKTIAAAVEAQISSTVAGALLSEETFSAFVIAALQQKIQVGSSYDKKTMSYIDHITEEAIKTKTKEVVSEQVESLADAIKAEVRDALAKSIGVIADGLVDGFVAHASGRYPSITVTFPDRS